MKGDLLGYRFGGTEEDYLVPVLEAPAPVEAQRQREWVKEHPGPTEFALCSAVCAWYNHPDGRRILTEVSHPR